MDVILTAKNGYIDFFNEDYLADGYEVDCSHAEGATIKSIFRLIRVLAKQGTVSAIDWECYYNLLTEID